MQVRTLFSSCALLLALAFVPSLQAQLPEPSSLHASSIPAAQLIQPEELSGQLKTGNAPLVLQVGSHLFFTEAHIPGAQYAGPGSQPAGIELLEKSVSSLPKNRFIVLYCGCCPWNRCPNVGPAYKKLHDLGFTNVKVLYLANNFGADWVNKGLPTQAGN